MAYPVESLTSKDRLHGVTTQRTHKIDDLRYAKWTQISGSFTYKTALSIPIFIHDLYGQHVN